MFTRLIGLVALGGLLVACSTPAGMPAPTSAPAPTDLPAPTSAPAPTDLPAPTSAPVATAQLPSALYFLAEGQVVRLETDGVTRSVLTAEQPFTPDALAIVTLAVSPDDTTLAYVLQGAVGNTLILTDRDGQDRRVLIENAPLGTIRWSPNGSALAVQMGDWQETGPWSGGVWAVSAFSGEATRLLSNDPPPSDMTTEAWAYAPEAWSPDGNQLLLTRYSQNVEFCDAVFLDVISGTVTPVPTPPDLQTFTGSQCAGGAWATDSSGVHVVMRGSVFTPPEAGLWFAPVNATAVRAVVPVQTATGQYNIVQGQFVAPDGSLYALIAQLDQIPELTDDPDGMQFTTMLFRIGNDGNLSQLHPDTFTLYGEPRWHPDGSGVLLPILVGSMDVGYLYVPFNGEIITLDLEPTSDLAWGD